MSPTADPSMSPTADPSMSPTVNPSLRPSIIMNNKSFINPSTNVKIDNYVYIIISVVGFSIILGALLYVFIGPIWFFQVARIVASRVGCR